MTNTMPAALPVDTKNSNLTLYTVIFYSSAILLAGAAACYKLLALHYWRYPGDIFLVEQLLTETLRGNFGLEFAFGKFGCHYYFFLLLLLPFKMLLGSNMLLLLVVLPVILHLATSIIIFSASRTLTGSAGLSCVCAMLFLFTPRIMSGLYSYYHGSAVVDDVSGYSAVLFVLFLVLYNRTNMKKYFYWFLGMYCLFLSLAELFVLLGTIYFTINALYYKRRDYVCLAFISLGIFSMQVYFRDTFFLPTNWNMFNLGIEGLKFFLNPRLHVGYLLETSPKLLFEYFSVLFLLCFIFLLLFRRSGKSSILLASLFLMGLMKCGIGYIVKDPHIHSWHNCPGVIMMTGALVIDIACRPSIKKAESLLLGLAAGCFILFFLFGDIAFLQKQGREIADRKEFVSQRRDYFVEMINLIDPDKLSIIPDDAKADAIRSGYSRFILARKFQLRLDTPPPTVDYILLPAEGAELLYTMTKNGDTDSLRNISLGSISNDFSLLAGNTYYRLYHRTGISEVDKQMRSYLFGLMGLPDDT